MYREAMASYAGVITRMGIAAAQHDHSDLHYRCMDGLGFLGVTAIRTHSTTLAIACMSGLVQLGRIARARNLPCFWDRCGLLPDAHAEDRIGWMISWVTHYDANGRERWARTSGDALSRLRGTRTNVQFAEEGGRVKYHIVTTDQPYAIGILDDGRHAQVDYSDPTMLKDFMLY
jgi:hypothetical protein